MTYATNDNSRRFRRGTFEFIEAKIRREAARTEYGGDFEWLCRQFLLHAPQYRGKIDRVWLWNDWPERWGPDKGIDLVVRTSSGELWAVQCKAHRPDRTVPIHEIDRFLVESNRDVFSTRLLIATTDRLSQTVRASIKSQAKPVLQVLRGDLLAAEVQWPTQIGGRVRPRPKKTPKPHQRTAIEAVLAGFQTNDRGQLIMACGSGKTLIAVWVSERMDCRRVLILVPSLSLVGQTMAEWGQSYAGEFDSLIVCSDETVMDRGEDHAVMSTSELGTPVTTDVKEIAEFLSKRRRSRAAIVFCTYQSSDRIAEAQDSARTPFDLVIADEAHRCTGARDSLFATVLHGEKIRANRRLFMTATQKIITKRVTKRANESEFEVASMDGDNFGPVFHRLPFGTAIAKKLLTDYRVVVIGVTNREAKSWAKSARLLRTENDNRTDARTLAVQIGLAKAIKKFDLRKVVTFHSSVLKAKRFADPDRKDSLAGVIQWLPEDTRPAGEIWTKHVSGTTPAGIRQTLLASLADLPGETRGIISNCACLGEGVDVPSLDGIAFIDPKRSVISIIQAVGRVIRRAGDKEIGTIVVPVFVDDSEDAETALHNSSFDAVWQVVKALRAHDERLAERLDTLRISLEYRSSSRGGVRLPENFVLDIPSLLPKGFEEAFHAKTVEMTSNKPPLTEARLLEWIEAHRERTGRFPTSRSGPVCDAPTENWLAVSHALYYGVRGLSGGSSLAKLIAKHFGSCGPRQLSIEDIVVWAKAYHQRMREWPRIHSGSIFESPGDTWLRIHSCLQQGNRGLPGGTTLAKLLRDQLGVTDEPETLTIAEILEWAEAFKKRNGCWPNQRSGRVHEAPDYTWKDVDNLLVRGAGDSPKASLHKLLQEHRGVPKYRSSESLSEEQVLTWAKAHHARTGNWPKINSGPIPESPGDTWRKVHEALLKGYRGLDGGSTLRNLLKDKLGVVRRRVRRSKSRAAGGAHIMQEQNTSQIVTGA